MSNRTFSILIIMVFMIALLVACNPGTTTIPTPTNSPVSTYMPPATATAAPSSTPTTPPTQTPTVKVTSTPTRTSAPQVTEAVVACPGAPDISLKIDDWAMVSTDPPLPNKIRSQPGTSGELIGQVQPGDNVLVLEGPQCGDGYTWWFVRSLDGLVGWTVEGDVDGYWLVDPISPWHKLPKPLASLGTEKYNLREISITADKALVSSISGDYLPLATPIPIPQTMETPLPNDPRFSEFGTAQYAAQSSYNVSGLLGRFINIYELEDPLSRYYLNQMSYDDCTDALRKNLDKAEIEPAYLDPFCAVNGGIPLHFIADVKPIQFTGGKGVRYLLSSGNYLTANKLEYRFQGLSDDGRYYISGFFDPILHPYIVDDPEIQKDIGPLLAWKEGQYEEAQKSYDLFNARIEELLNAGVVTLYPSLEFLDSMMESIVVK